MAELGSAMAADERGAQDVGPAGRDENAAERADRNMDELLQELRVVLPGVQVLFAFLLTIPFAQGFDKLTADETDLYFGVVMTTVLATALLMAPSAYHRAVFRQRDKTHLVKVSSRLTIAGLAMLAVSITGAVLLVASLIFDGAKVTIFTVVAGGAFVLLWAVLPLARRAKLEADER